MSNYQSPEIRPQSFRDLHKGSPSPQPFQVSDLFTNIFFS